MFEGTHTTQHLGPFSDEPAQFLTLLFQVKKGSSDVCSAVGAVTSVSATLMGITLTAGDLYVISVTVSAPGRTSGVASQEVNTLYHLFHLCFNRAGKKGVVILSVPLNSHEMSRLMTKPTK